MWLNTMDKMGLGRDHIDIKWLALSWKVSVKGFLVGQRMTMILFATHSQGAQWWRDVDVFKKLKADIDMEYVATENQGSVWNVVLLHDQVKMKNAHCHPFLRQSA